MYLKLSHGYKGRTYLSFVQGYRDENGKTKQKTIQKIGYLDELKQTYDDPVLHFKQVAKQKSKDEIKEYTIKNLNSKIIDNENAKKNLGYVILKRIYKDLNIDSLLNEKQKKLKVEYNLNDIFELLVYSRILFPDSKLATFNNKNTFFDKFNFSENDMYRSLNYLGTYKDEILTLLWKNTKDVYKRDTSISYYDTTNYYFEISYNDEDELNDKGEVIRKGQRKKGPSKEHRKTPIIQMGLLMDKNSIPIYYDLFPGNESEKLQMRPTLKKTKAKFGIDRTIIVADRGQNTSDNIFFVAGKNNDDHNNHDGYVYGQSILNGDKEFKTWALEQNNFICDKIYDSDGKLVTYKEAKKDCDGKIIGYEEKPVIFKHKSRIYAKNIKIERDGKRNCSYQIYQKQMVYYSKKYADRQKHLRETAIEKAKDLINNPSKYTKTTSYGCTKYINNINFDDETGEVKENLKLSLKIDKIKEEEKIDGYYSIVTSEKHLSDKEIRDIYKGLWKIEESFKITKSELETRPVFVWTPTSIETHFLSCFISLLIIRLLEYKLNKKYSVPYILDSIRNYESTKIEHDIYLQNFRNDVIKDLEKVFNIDLSRKYLTLSEIKKILNF